MQVHISGLNKIVLQLRPCIIIQKKIQKNLQKKIQKKIFRILFCKVFCIFFLIFKYEAHAVYFNSYLFPYLSHFFFNTLSKEILVTFCHSCCCKYNCGWCHMLHIKAIGECPKRKSMCMCTVYITLMYFFLHFNRNSLMYVAILQNFYDFSIRI